MFDGAYHVRRWLILHSKALVETLIISLATIWTTVIMEGWRASGRWISNIIAILLGFFNQKAVRKWFGEKRTRILVRETTRILDGDFELDDESSSEEESSRSGSLLKLNDLKKRSVSDESSDQAPKRAARVIVFDDSRSKKLYAHEKISTGFLEDLRLGLLMSIEHLRVWSLGVTDNLFSNLASFRFRRFFLSLFYLQSYVKSTLWFISLIYTFFKLLYQLVTTPLLVPKRIHQFSKSVIKHARELKEELLTKGYPFEEYTVTADDGHILTLGRLPNVGSKKVLYLQHGVFDSSYAWFAETHDVGMNIAFRAHDLGYDVFAGTLRGCAPTKKHIDPNISSAKYWDFTVNEHAFSDIPSFVEKIREIKASEGITFSPTPPKVLSPENANREDVKASVSQDESGDDLPILTVVSHSMGAMASLMYLVRNCMENRPHYISNLVLLSPAGYHQTAPLLCKVTGPLISTFLWLFPSLVLSFRFPTEGIRIFVAKMMEDVQQSYSIRNFVSFIAFKLLGGKKNEHAYLTAHNITYNVFSGTSAGIFKHFWQVYKSQKFEAFDYGPQKNTKVYGSPTPIDFFANYPSINIPVHFVMGLRDTLIEPISIMKHYALLADAHPELAHLKAFPKMGHIDFTLGANAEVSNYILTHLGNEDSILSSS